MPRDVHTAAAEAAHWIATVPARLLLDDLESALADRSRSVGEPEVGDGSTAAAEIYAVLQTALADSGAWDVAELPSRAGELAKRLQRAAAETFGIKATNFKEIGQSISATGAAPEFHPVFDLADLGIFVFDVLYRVVACAGDEPATDLQGERIGLDRALRQFVGGELVPGMAFGHRPQQLDPIMAKADDGDQRIWAALKDGSTWEDAAAGR